MFTSTKAMRLAAAAVVAFFGGLSTPAWATYGGGACHSCAPPAVVESQCNVVALAPQVQTVYQTVYETVYDYEPMTVMETRYRMAYKTENYTVMRPVLGNQLRRAALHRDEAGVPDRQPGASLHRDEAGLPDRAARASLHGAEAGVSDRQPASVATP